jgi:transposase
VENERRSWLREGAVMDGMVLNGGLTSRVSRRRVRRRWSAAQKAAIVAESYAPGAVASEVSARYGVNESLVYTWRRQAMVLPRRGADGDANSASRSSEPLFSRVTVCDDAPVADQRPQRTTGCIEITMADMNIRVAAGVDALTLAVVLAAMRGMG